MAGIHLFRSNRVEVLVELLAAQLKLPGGDPLDELEIVVGSRGMERHLRHVLAERLGICANVEFPFPTAAVDAAMATGEGADDPWAPASLTWVLADVLPAIAVAPGCEPLAGYLQAEGPIGGDLDARAYGLAKRLADLFDRYVTYRPEMAIAWSEGRDDGSDAIPGQEWQPALWRAVRDRVGGRPHRAQRLAEAFAGAAVLDGQGPLRVFALSSLPKSWLDALAHVASARDVELYQLSPTDAYAADLGDAGHPLGQSWGRVARDMQVVLDELPDGIVGVGFERFYAPIEAADGSPDATALHVLQDDIRTAGHPRLAADFADRVLDPADRSVQFHDCHGAVRQVEVLRDVLLGLFDADPTLQPRDVVVMTPDVDGFAPAFASVFDRGERAPGVDGGWERSGTPRIPYEIVDQTMRRLNPVADALLRVLGLVDGRATASEVLDLLALEPVSERFGFSGDDVARVREWVLGAGIRWGADAAHRGAFDQPEDAQNTWRFGLDRLLLGVVMRDDGRQVAGIRPFEAVEGGEVRLLGALCGFTDALFAQIEALRSPRPVRAWVTAMDTALSALTRTSGKAAWLSLRVRDELQGLADEATCAEAERTVAPSGMRAALEGRFEVAAPAVRGSGGAVAFCGMVPERAVPHRIVCLIGMDEGAFPRQTRRLAFDLTGHPRRVGDRDVRDEDRYLLLEAVLSARDHLVVLYTGRDPRSNKAVPPAVPVCELRDALDVSWPWIEEKDRPSDNMTTSHPLQAFDRRNFEVSADGPWTFDRRLLAGARAAAGSRTERAPFLSMDTVLPALATAADTVDVDELVMFWRQPVRAFLRHRIGLSLRYDDGEERVDREPIELAWIEQSDLLRQVLDRRRDGIDLAGLTAALRGEGGLPLGRFGDAALASAAAVAAGLATEAEAAGWRAGEARGVDVDVTVPGGRVVGRIVDVLDDGLVAFAYGGESPGALLEGWVRTVAWQTETGAASARTRLLFGKVKANGRADCSLIGLESAEPSDHLAALTALRAEGLTRPLPFFAKASHAFAKSALSSKEPLAEDARDPDVIALGGWDAATEEVFAGATEAAVAMWEAGESSDRYHRHVFGDVIPFLDDGGGPSPAFASLAIRVWGPILAARRTSRTVESWRIA